jgi:hypothetical protein
MACYHTVMDKRLLERLTLRVQTGTAHRLRILAALRGQRIGDCISEMIARELGEEQRKVPDTGDYQEKSETIDKL